MQAESESSNSESTYCVPSQALLKCHPWMLSYNPNSNTSPVRSN